MAGRDEQGGALTTAAVAAAAGAAVYGLRRALTSGGGSPSRGSRDEESDEGSRGGALLETVWESASESVLPVLEDAADAAGRWLGENSPDIVRRRILPRFIEAFQDAA